MIIFIHRSNCNASCIPLSGAYCWGYGRDRRRYLAGSSEHQQYCKAISQKVGGQNASDGRNWFCHRPGVMPQRRKSEKRQGVPVKSMETWKATGRGITYGGPGTIYPHVEEIVIDETSTDIMKNDWSFCFIKNVPEMYCWVLQIKISASGNGGREYDCKEIFLETIKRTENRNGFLKTVWGTWILSSNPASTYIRGNRHRGMEPMKDRFGTEILWPADQLAAMPHVTESNKVISDICEWKEQLKMPDFWKTVQIRLSGEPFGKSSGNPGKRKAFYGIYANRSVWTASLSYGIWGYADEFFFLDRKIWWISVMLLRVSLSVYETDRRYNLHPDAMLSHDDWGSKISFCKPGNMERVYLSPQYAKKPMDIWKKKESSSSIMGDFMEPAQRIWWSFWRWRVAGSSSSEWYSWSFRNSLQEGWHWWRNRRIHCDCRVDSTEEEIRREVRRACEEYVREDILSHVLLMADRGCLFPSCWPDYWRWNWQI